MKKIFVNPTIDLVSVETKESILVAGSGGNIVDPNKGGNATQNSQETDGNGDGLARTAGPAINVEALDF